MTAFIQARWLDYYTVPCTNQPQTPMNAGLCLPKLGIGSMERGEEREQAHFIECAPPGQARGSAQFYLDVELPPA
jgi:hypothetical protein